jgi:hypothetical protein
MVGFTFDDTAKRCAKEEEKIRRAQINMTHSHIALLSSQSSSRFREGLDSFVVQNLPDNPFVQPTDVNHRPLEVLRHPGRLGAAATTDGLL